MVESAHEFAQITRGKIARLHPDNIPDDVYYDLIHQARAEGKDPVAVVKNAFPDVVNDKEARLQIAKETAQQLGFDATPQQLEIAAGKEFGLLDGFGNRLPRAIVNDLEGLDLFNSRTADYTPQALLGKLFGLKNPIPKDTEQQIQDRANARLQAVENFQGLSEEDISANPYGERSIGNFIGDMVGVVAPQLPLMAATSGAGATSLAGRVGVGALTNAAEGAISNLGYATDEAGTDYDQFGKSVALDAAFGGAFGGAVHGVVRGSQALKILKKGKMKADMDTKQLKQINQANTNEVMQSLQNVEMQKAASQAEQQAMEQVNVQKAQEVVGRNFPDEVDLVGTESYKAGRAQVGESLQSKAPPELEQRGFSERLNQQIDEAVSPREIADYADYQEISAKRANLRQELKAGLEDPNVDLNRIKSGIKAADDELASIDIKGIQKKLDGVFDSTLKEFEAPPKPRFSEGGPQSETGLREFINDLETSKTGQGTEPKIREANEEIFIRNKLGANMKKDPDASLLKVPELKEQFSELKAERAKLYDDLKKTSDPNLVDSTVKKIQKIESQLFQKPPKSFKAGSKDAVMAEAVYKGKIIPKDPSLNIKQAKAISPEFGKFYDEIEEPGFKSFVKNNVQNYDLAKQDFSAKLKRDYTKLRGVKKPSKEFSSLYDSDTKFRKRVDGIKDQNYKQYISDNIGKYDSKDKKLFSKIRQDFKEQGTSAFAPEKAKKLEAKDPETVNKAIKEIAEKKPKSRVESSLKEEVRCK